MFLRVTALTYLLFLAFEATSQVDWAFAVNANYASARDVTYQAEYAVYYLQPIGNNAFRVVEDKEIATHSIDGGVGGDVGMSVRIPIKANVHLSSGLALSLLRYVAKTRYKYQAGRHIEGIQPGRAGVLSGGIDTTVDGQITAADYGFNNFFDTPTYPEPSGLGQTTILMVSVPVILNLTLTKRWIMSAGVSTSLLGYARTNAERYAESGGTELYSANSANQHPRVSLAATLSAEYLLTPHFSIGLVSSHFLTPIYREKPVDFGTDRKARLYTFSLGMRYWLRKQW